MAIAKEEWSELGLSVETIDLVEKEGFVSPTPVQKEAVPVAIDGQDLLVSAETGSGKTVAFCFPMIEKIRGQSGTLGLILCPTREIALQTYQTLLKFAAPQGVTSVVTIGGKNMRQETKELAEYPNIIVATPGRACDHQERGNIWLEYIQVVVLDEADRMLDMGFSKQLNQILDRTPKDRQTLLFSATVGAETERLARKYLNNPKKITIGTAVSVVDTVEQELLWVNARSKMRELVSILRSVTGTVIVFTRTKIDCNRVWASLHSKGFHDSGYISSSKLQKHREKVLDDVRSKKIRILVATDVAGRGIDVEDVVLVVNYDFPQSVEDYIHRVGRTGRKGKAGKAVTFVMPGDSRDLVQIEKSLGIVIKETRAADYKYVKPAPVKRRGFRSKSFRPRRKR